MCKVMITGTDRNDTLRGTDSNEYIYGFIGDDLIYGGDGSDWLTGGSGNDEIYGEDGKDELEGNEGNDILGGGRDADKISGNKGNDYIYTGAEDIWVYGRDIGSAIPETDVYGKPMGTADVADYTNYWNAGDTFPKIGDGTRWAGDGSWKSATFRLDDGYANFSGATNLLDSDNLNATNVPSSNTVTMNGIEHIILGVGDEKVKVGNPHNTVYGDKADNIFVGGKYNDYLDGGDGSDKLVGGVGNDTLIGGAGTDYAVYKTGFQYFFGHTNFDGDLELDLSQDEGTDTIRGIERFIFGASVRVEPGTEEPITITGDVYELNIGDDGYQASDFTLVG